VSGYALAKRPGVDAGLWLPPELARAAATQRPKQPSGTAWPMPAGARGRRGEQVSEWDQAAAIRGGYRGHAFTASNALANRIAKLKWRLIAVNTRDGSEEEIFAHVLLDALRRPNEYQFGQRAFHSLSVHLDFAGETYWFKSRNASRATVGFWPLPPYLVRPIWMQGEGMIGYRYYIGGRIGAEGIDIPRSEIVHFAEPNPDDPIRGFARARAGERELAADAAMKDFRETWFDNECQPDYVVTTEVPPGFDAVDTLEEIEALIRIHHGGRRNWGKPMILPKGTAVTQLTHSLREMQFTDLAAESRDESFEMMGFNRMRAGYVDGIVRANADAMDYVWAQDTVEPRAELIAATLTHQVAEIDYPENARNGVRLEVRPPKDLVPRDREFDLQKARTYVEIGVLTRNELREDEGKEPIEGGDVPLVPVGLAPLGEVAQGIAAYSQPSAPAPTSSDVPDVAAETPATDATAEAPRSRIVRPHTRILLPTSDARSAYWHRALPRLDSLERTFARGLVAVFAKQRERVLSKARAVAQRELDRYAGWKRRKVVADIRRRGVRAPGDDLLHDAWDVSSENNSLMMGMRPYHANAFNSGARLGADQVNVSWDVNDPRAAEWLRKHGLEAADDINKTTRSKLARVISFGVEGGQTIDEIVQSMGDVYDELDRSRRFMIARTETTTASNHGQLTAWTDPETTGIVDRKQWISSRDDRVRDEHEALDGMIVGVNDEFAPGLSAPGDPSAGPAQIVNCRCVMAPVFAGD